MPKIIEGGGAWFSSACGSRSPRLGVVLDLWDSVEPETGDSESGDQCSFHSTKLLVLNKVLDYNNIARCCNWCIWGKPKKTTVTLVEGKEKTKQNKKFYAIIWVTNLPVQAKMVKWLWDFAHNTMTSWTISVSNLVAWKYRVKKIKMKTQFQRLICKNS